MKRKLLVFGMLLTLGIVFSGPQNAQAGTWATVSIDRVGQASPRSSIVLTHISATPTFTKKYFLFNVASEKQMLAVALTALSLGKTLLVEISTDGVTLDKILVSKD